MVGVALASLALGAAFAGEPERSLARLPVDPQPRLGLAFPGADPGHYHEAAALGAGVVRLAVEWLYLEPRPGQVDWGPLDARIAELQRLGIEPFLTIYSNAPWATLPSQVKNAVPRSMERWAAFVGAIAERYDADGFADGPGLRRPVRWYQVANEWISARNTSGGWDGRDADLIAYVNAAHDAVKAASPKTIFVLGGVASYNADVMVRMFTRADYVVQQRWGPEPERTTRLSAADLSSPRILGATKSRVLPVLAEARYDMADVHLYGPEERDPVRIGVIRMLSGGRPVLSSECGGPSLDYRNQYRPGDHFMAAMTRNLSVLAEGLPFCLWFRLAEGSGTFGNRRVPLLTETGAPKPAAHAYRLLARLLAGGGPVQRLRGLELFAIHRRDAPPIFVLLRPEGPPLRLYELLPFSDMTGLEVVQVTDPVSGAYEKKFDPPPDMPLTMPVVVLGERLPLP